MMHLHSGRKYRVAAATTGRRRCQTAFAQTPVGAFNVLWFAKAPRYVCCYAVGVGAPPTATFLCQAGIGPATKLHGGRRPLPHRSPGRCGYKSVSWRRLPAEDERDSPRGTSI